MKKRVIASFLCALIISSTAAVLSSCAEGDSGGPSNTDGNSNINGDVTDNTESGPGVPSDVRFDTDGERLEINFAISETDGDGFHLRSIEADDVDESDKVDVAVSERNALIEDMLGVDIVVYAYELNSNIRGSAVYTAIMGQSDEFDVIAGRQWDDIDICLDGNLVDLANLYDDVTDTKIDYLSLDQPWWSGYYIDAMKINDSVYWVTGDLCLRYTGGFYCFFVNETLYEQDLMNAKSDLLTAKYGEDTVYGPIYDLVTKGDWTLDILNEMVAKAYHDDGNDKVDRNDVLGCALPIWDNTNGLSVAAGVEFSRRTADTIQLLATNTNSTLITFMEKMYSLIKSGYIYNYGGDYQGAMSDFAGDRACMISGRLNQAELYLTNMTTDYHIIPSPKMDFNQKNYRSSVHDAINLYGISYFSSRKAATAATLELMAYYSYKDVRPIYYDQALKGLYTTDEGAGKMIDLMGKVVYSDFVYIWQFSDYFGNTNGHGGLGDFLRNAVNSSKPSSQIKKNEKRWSTGLDKILEAIDELEEE